MARPFEGIRIIDITHVLAGPFAAYQLGLMGADVIKVEHPDDPDQSRDSGSDNDLNHANMGTGFLTQASNKRAITLEPEDRTRARDPEEAGRHRRCAGGELPAGRVRGAGARLRGDAQGQSEADLCVVLGVRPGWAATRADRVRPRDPVDLRHHGDDRHAGGQSDQDRRTCHRLCHRHDGRLRSVRSVVPTRAHRARSARRHGDARCGDHPDGLACDRVYAEWPPSEAVGESVPVMPPAWRTRRRMEW